MAQALGYVAQTENGNFEGVLSLGLDTRIRILANDAKTNERQPDFRVYAGHHGEIGGGWTRVGKTSNKEYISLTLAHPMIGPRKVYANLGRVKDTDGDEFAILWNPKD